MHYFLTGSHPHKLFGNLSHRMLVYFYTSLPPFTPTSIWPLVCFFKFIFSSGEDGTQGIIHAQQVL